jgi:glycine hydroxymethyltransferase
LQEALSDDFKVYQSQIVKNAKAMAEELIFRGLRLVSGGTDNHLMLVDLTDKGLTGKEVEEALDRAGITTNKNGIPFDTKSPQVTSGVRLGTPAVTTRGMKENEMKTIARLISHIVDDVHNEKQIEEVRKEVSDLCDKFPLYSE